MRVGSRRLFKYFICSTSRLLQLHGLLRQILRCPDTLSSYLATHASFDKFYDRSQVVAYNSGCDQWETLL